MSRFFARLGVWAAIFQFAGACLIPVGFRLKPIEGAFVGDLSGVYQQVAVQTNVLWIYRLGWALLALGFFLRLCAEYQTARRETAAASEVQPV